MQRLIINKLDVYRIFQEIVKNYPLQSPVYLRPDTFAALKYRDQFFDTAFGKTEIYQTIVANQGLFFSRIWEANNYDVNKIDYDFPLVFLLEMEDKASSYDRPTGNFILGVMDIDERDKSIDQRSDEVKRNDLDVMLRSIINESLNYVYASRDNISFAWESENKIKAELSTDIIEYFRGQFLTNFKNHNELQLKVFEEYEKSKKLIGVMCDVNIQLETELKTFDYTV